MKAPRPVIDLIWTQTGVGCCLATHMAWGYGLRSDKTPCPCARPRSAHRVMFVDNNYRRYDHAAHVATVAVHRPRYATVRDVMTVGQCAAAGIEYAPLEQILDWATELEAHAENVIIVPKYDCLDQIPARFMLGYSVPTRYGGTPLPIERFAGRRVHLLGGTPARQIDCFERLPGNVVSLDNNQIHLKAEWGDTWRFAGYRKLQSLPGHEGISEWYGLWPCVALSLAHMTTYFLERRLPSSRAAGQPKLPGMHTVDVLDG